MPVLKMRRFAPRRSLSLLAFSFLPLGGQAEVLMLEPTVVSATSTKRALKDVPASVAVITAEDLSRRPVRDLEDALRGSEGLQFNGIGMSRRGISIRGMSSEHTLVLIDGKRISPSAGAIAHSDFDLGWVPVEAIERIEVVRGPMSSLYGSEALGGVVNVITRKATDTWLGSGFVEGAFVRMAWVGKRTRREGTSAAPCCRVCWGWYSMPRASVSRKRQTSTVAIFPNWKVVTATAAVQR